MLLPCARLHRPLPAVFLLIGAHSFFPPSRDETLFDVFAGLQWRSVFVEASPPVFLELSKRRLVWLASREEEEEGEPIDVTILNAAVCAETQDVTFYSPSKTLTGGASRSAVGAHF